MVPPSPFAKKLPRSDSAMMYQTQSRKRGHQVSAKTPLEKSAHMPITKSTLNTAEPTIVPKPTPVGSGLKVSINDVNNSGAEPPAAMSVAPAMSSESFIQSLMRPSAGTK